MLGRLHGVRTGPLKDMDSRFIHTKLANTGVILLSFHTCEHVEAHTWCLQLVSLAMSSSIQGKEISFSF